MKKLERSVKDAIKSIRDGNYKGTFYKLELEAELGRDYRGDDDYCDCDECQDARNEYISCDECNQMGIVDCDECPDEGDCSICDNTGEVACSECEGSGEVPNPSYDEYHEPHGGDETDEWCEEYLNDQVSEAARKARTYSRFYNDGSVDSEFTITLPLTWEGIGYGVEYIKAMRKLADYIGNGLDVEGAGMHITILNSPTGTFPGGNRQLNQRYFANFEKQMTKLMPALYLLASEDNKARPVGDYRRPGVGKYGHDTAVELSSKTDGSNTAVIEWRVFETCYKRPEMLYDFICTIAKGLEFYGPDKKVEFKRQIGEISFVDDYGAGIHRLYQTSKHIDALNEGLPHLCPDHRSCAEAKRLRNLKVTKKALQRKEARIKQLAAAEWETLKPKNRQDEASYVKAEVKYRMERDKVYGETRDYKALAEQTRTDFRQQNPTTKRGYIAKRLAEAIPRGVSITI